MSESDERLTHIWILDVFLAVFTFPVVLTMLMLPCWVYKQLVVCAAKICYPKLHIVPLNACESRVIDTIPTDHVNSDSDMEWNLGLVLHLKRTPSFTTNSFREKFQKLFLQVDSSGCPNPQFENLFKYLMQFGGYSFLVLANSMEVDFHIQEALVPDGQDLRKFLNAQLRMQYDPNTPFWKILLIPNPEAEDEIILFFKIHHSLADGQTLITHILSRLTETTIPQIVPAYRRKSTLNNLKLAIKAPRLLCTAFKEVYITKLPFKVESETESEYFSMTSLDLSKMKIIRQKTGCKFMCIFLTLMGGVLRRIYLEESRENDMPESIFTTIAAPLPNHPSLLSVDARMCNYWTAGLVRIPLKPENSLERLKLIAQGFNDFAGVEYQKLAKSFAINLLGILPNWLRKFYINATTTALQIEYSENMGSSETQYINGAVIKSIEVLLIGSGLKNPAFSALSFSYNNQFKCRLKINKALCRNQDGCDMIAREYVSEALNELVAQVTK